MDEVAYWHECGADGCTQTNRVLYERDLEWAEEEDRRKEPELPIEELLLLDMMSQL